MLSIIINVKNGEQFLSRCLSALSRFDDVVVLDNYSTDKTIQVAKSFPNVRVFEHEFCGMGKVRNIASGYARYDWVFFVDCDEIVNQQLVDSLLNTKFDNHCVYSVFRYNYYDNFRVDSSSWDNDWVLRLYNRNETGYIETEVHESVDKKGMPVKKIESGYIYHFPYENVAKLIDKMQFYSTLYAKQNFGKKTCNIYLLPFRAAMMFFKCYILKRGFMQGYEGFAISSFNTIGVFAKYIKLYELTYKRKIALGIYVPHTGENLLPLIKHINEQTLLPQMVVVCLPESQLTPEGIAKADQLLKHNLVIPAKIVAVSDNGKSTLKTMQKDEPELENIVYLHQPKLLENKHFFKQCKTALLKGRPVLKTDIF